jgi:long-chain acyl-CoA synthetase
VSPAAAGIPARDVVPTEVATLPLLLQQQARSRPTATALRHKQLGIWHEVGWRELEERVAAAARLLADSGVGPGDVLGIVADNSVEWLVLQLAAQTLRASVVAPHPDAPTDELVAALGAVRPAAVFAPEERHSGLVDQLRTERGVVLLPAHAGRPGEAGSSSTSADADWFSAGVAQCSATDVALHVVAPDGSGRSTPVTHGRLLDLATSLTGPSRGATTRCFLVEPLGSVWAQVTAVAAHLRHGFALSIPENPATARDDLREIAPDLVTFPARSWERIADDLQAALRGAGPIGRSWSRRALERDNATSGAGLTDFAVRRPIRDRIGLARRCQAFASAGPLRQDAQELIRAAGIDLRELVADHAGLPLAVQEQARRLDGAPVVQPLGGAELDVDESGDVLARRAGTTAGTGRVGRRHDGAVAIMGERSTALDVAGKQVFPELLESRLRTSRYIAEAFVDRLRGSDALAALLVLHEAEVGRWADDRGLHAPGYGPLARLPEVGELLSGEAVRLLADAPLARIGILQRPLDAAHGEVWPDGRQRRPVVAARLGAALDQAVAAGTTETELLRIMTTDGRQA